MKDGLIKKGPKKLTKLATWTIRNDPNCNFCGRHGNLEHILTSCSLALKDRRYRWRHDKVLFVLADVFEKIKVETSDDKQSCQFRVSKTMLKEWKEDD